MADIQRKTANLLNESDFGLVEVAAGTYRVGTDVGVLPQGTYIFNADKSASALQLYRTTKNGNTYNYEAINDLPYSFTADGLSNQIFRSAGNTGSSWADLGYTNLMLNTGSTALPYEPYGWVHSLRKLTTATEAVENPLYSDGTAITAYTLKGNEEHTGTPSPQNPVMPNGVGNKTANLFNIANVVQQPNVLSVSGTTITKADNTTYNIDLFSGASGASTAMSNKSLLLEAGTYTLSCDVVTGVANMFLIVVCPYTSATLEPVDKYFDGHNGKSFTLAEKSYVSLRIQQNSAVEVKDIMVTSGSQSPTSYIPYGYEIPILTAQGSAVNYLGSVQSYREIAKYIFDGTDNFTWTKSGTRNFSWFFNPLFLPDRGKEGTPFLCSHGATVTTLSEFVYGTVYADNTYNLGIFPSELTTVTELRQWLATQYANGTPVTIWYSLYTPTTATVNEPLMKIGDYADSISNAMAIPTTDGANSITVDTTVQPSEFTATWTGWHNAEVKEKSENLFDKDNADMRELYPNSETGLVTISVNTRMVTISCEPNTTYTVSKGASSRFNIACFDDYPVAGDTATAVISDHSANVLSLTTTSGSHYLTVFFYFKPEDTPKTPEQIAATIMLNAGSTALPYEPYWK